MKRLFVGMVAITSFGCGDPKPKVEVNVPGVNVKAGPGGAEVNAPGVNVKAGPGGAEVKTPGVEVKTKKD